MSRCLVVYCVHVAIFVRSLLSPLTKPHTAKLGIKDREEAVAPTSPILLLC